MMNRESILQKIESVAAGMADDIHYFRNAGNVADADLLEQVRQRYGEIPQTEKDTAAC